MCGIRLFQQTRCCKSNSPSSNTILWGYAARSSKEKETYWIDFVKLKRAGWEPSRESHVCSKHFKADDFMRTLNLPGLDERTYPRLKGDDLGITAYPTVQSAIEKQVNLSARTARAIRRKVRRQCFMVFIFYGNR